VSRLCLPALPAGLKGRPSDMVFVYRSAIFVVTIDHLYPGQMKVNIRLQQSSKHRGLAFIFIF